VLWNKVGEKGNRDKEDKTIVYIPYTQVCLLHENDNLIYRRIHGPKIWVNANGHQL
jgi:hypothetical protein